MPWSQLEKLRAKTVKAEEEEMDHNGMPEEEDLEYNLWQGDETEVKPWHPLHAPAPFPENEDERVEALLAESILDTPAEPEFDALTQIGRRTFGVEIVAISFVDHDRQWCKAKIGLDNEEIDRDISICAHAILQNEPLVILDATQDPRFMYNEVVTRPPFVRFYAGAQLVVSRKGKQYVVGTYCVMDSNPREIFGELEVDMLKTLATMVMSKMETRQRLPAHGPLSSQWQDGGLEQRMITLKLCTAFTARQVDDTCIRKFAEKLRPRVFQAGHYVTRRGMPGDPMYLIASGKLACILNGQQLEVLGKGQCFGEVSLINLCKMRSSGVSDEEARKRCLRGADILALERCELLELSFDDAWPLIRIAPNLWFTLEDMAKGRAHRIKLKNQGMQLSRCQSAASRPGSFNLGSAFAAGFSETALAASVDKCLGKHRDKQS